MNTIFILITERNCCVQGGEDDDEDDDDQSPPAVFCLDLITLRIDEPLILSAASE